MELEDWFKSLGVDSLFVDLGLPGFKDGALAKREDKSCVFLGEDNLCEIHRKYGLEAKPAACQLFPFVLTPFNGKLQISLRFDCVGVCRNGGESLKSNTADVKRIAEKIYPSGISKEQYEKSSPAITKKQTINAVQLERVNSVILDTYRKSEEPLAKKLLWLGYLAEHIEKVKWSGQSQNDFDGLLSLLVEGTYKEISRQEISRREVQKKARVLFGQVLYLLSRSPGIVTIKPKGKIAQIKQRFRDAAEVRKFGNCSGPVPKLWDNWGELDLSEMEKSFGNMPAKACELLDRYIINRMAGMSYFGVNYYNYSLTDGLYSLILAICAINWLGRVHAVNEGKDKLEYKHIEDAVIIADSNNGYGSALNAGTASLRLEYLKGYVYELVSCYVDG